MQVLLEKVSLLFESGLNRESIAEELQMTLTEVDAILDEYERQLNELKGDSDVYCCNFFK